MSNQDIGVSQTRNSEKSVAIVGAGIVGLSIALRLHLDGYQVTVIDKADPMTACSAGNAGYLSEANIFPPASLDILKKLPQLLLGRESPLVIQPSYLPKLLRWALPAMKFNTAEKLEEIASSMASLLRIANRSFSELTDAAGASHLLDRKGGVVAYKTSSALAEKSKSVPIWLRHGIDAQVMSAEEIAEFEPSLVPMAGAIYFPNSGRCMNPKSLGEHYFRRLVTDRAKFVRKSVKAISLTGDGRPLVRFEDGEVEFSKVVLATGFDKTLIQRFLDFNLPMVSERGYHLMLPISGVNLARPVVFGEPMFAATPMENGLRLAGTAEFAYAEREPQMNRAYMLFKMAKEYMPQLSDERAVPWMGVRPTLPDGRPAIGQLRGASNIFYAIGHSHNGLTTSAVTANCIADLVRGFPSPVNIAPFSIGRFA